MKPTTVVVVSLVVLVVLIMLHNTHVVVVHFFLWRFALSQIVLILLILLAGFVLGYLFAKMPRKRRRKGLARLDSESARERFVCGG